MRMQKIASLTLAFLSILFILPPELGLRAVSGSSSSVRIFGLVDRDLTLTYSEMLSFPMVSEVANLKCVMGFPDVTYNWTGVPLFHLLTLAGIKPQAYKVVTRGSGGFESDLLVEDALQPTTILALGANGTVLPEIGGIQGFFRLVVPCKWGYKWVGDVDEIEVVDYDYKGTYESSGWSDDAKRTDCGPLPSITPPLHVFTLPFGNRTFVVKAFTNATISAFNFNYLQSEVDLNVTVPSGTLGFADIILDQAFLKGPYIVLVNEEEANALEANITQHFYLYIPLSEGFQTLRIVGTEFSERFPEVIVDYDQIAYVGEEAVFNASRSVDDGQIVSYQWDFGDGATGNGVVVSHAFSKEGIYQIKVNATDNDSLSGFKTISVTVKASQERIIFIARVFLIVLMGLLIFMFVVLLVKRKPVTARMSSSASATRISACVKIWFKRLEKSNRRFKKVTS